MEGKQDRVLFVRGQLHRFRAALEARHISMLSSGTVTSESSVE